MAQYKLSRPPINKVYIDGKVVDLENKSISISKSGIDSTWWLSSYNGSRRSDIASPFLCVRFVIYHNEFHLFTSYRDNNWENPKTPGAYEMICDHYTLNVGTGALTFIDQLPYGFRNGTVVVYNDEIHVLGGDEESAHKRYHYIWNDTDRTYVKSVNIPYDFFYGDAIEYDGELHIFGGGSTTGSKNHYIWNGTSWLSKDTKIFLPEKFASSFSKSVVLYPHPDNPEVDTIWIFGNLVFGGDKKTYPWYSYWDAATKTWNTNWYTINQDSTSFLIENAAVINGYIWLCNSNKSEMKSGHEFAKTLTPNFYTSWEFNTQLHDVSYAETTDSYCLTYFNGLYLLINTHGSSKCIELYTYKITDL